METVSEYFGIKVDEKDSWVIVAFTKFMNELEEETKKLGKPQWNEERKRLLFCSFYAGALFGGEVQTQKEG